MAEGTTKEKKNNIIVLSNKKKLEIKQTKLKYFSSGDYAFYLLFKEHGAHKIILMEDGREVALRFLSAVLDKPYTAEQVKDDKDEYHTEYHFDPEVEKLYDEEMTLSEFNKIVDLSLEVNEIDPN